MRFHRVHIDALAYELPSEVVTSRAIEGLLEPVYKAVRVAPGQIEALTGITERRWWPEGFKVTEGATRAARKALEKSGIRGDQLDLIIYGGVCRDYFEPATACAIGAALGVSEHALLYDVSNACLGLLNGIIDCANRIELGQVRAGLVVACESARDINLDTVRRLLEHCDMEQFKTSFATFTGGSGAVAIILTDGSFADAPRRRLLGGVHRSAAAHHDLCRWGLRKSGSLFEQFLSTDASSVLKHGIALASKTWHGLLDELRWRAEDVDRVICHQVGHAHQQSLLKCLGLDPARELPSYARLGNIGTVSLALTAALAEEQDFLRPGHRVGLLGIGSGLNCMMLGVEW